MTQPHWIAGPIGYDANVDFSGHEIIRAYSFDFVGATIEGKWKRYRLRYSCETRKFTGSTKPLTREEEWHGGARLVPLYRPLGILRSDLPKGSITNALTAMLTEEDKARCLSAAIEYHKQK